MIVLNRRLGVAVIDLVFALIGLWWALESRALGLVADSGELGAGAFPFGVGMLLFVGGLVSMGVDLARARHMPADPVQVSSQALLTMALTGVGAGAFIFLGPLVAALFLVSAFALVLGRRKPLAAAGLAVAIALGLYLLFDRLLGVQLPADLIAGDWR